MLKSYLKPGSIMDNARVFYLFQRFRSGRCSREEELEFIQHITENDNPQTRALLDELWDETAHKLPAGQAERILAEILRYNRSIPNVHTKERTFSWMKVAASVTAIAFLAAFAYYQLTHRQLRKETGDAESTPMAHRRVRLPDGSTVTLNAASNLDVPASFGRKDTREVTLTGEAFFDIKPDASRPFIVRTGNITTTVLGTAFNVKAYPADDEITVTVRRGKVEVSDEGNVLGILTPDQQITFSKATHVARQNEVASKEVVAWTDHDLYFDDVSMEEAMTQLSERFNVAIRFTDDRVKSCRFTATFISGEDLGQILDVICAFNQAKHRRDANTGAVEISGEGCSQ